MRVSQNHLFRDVATMRGKKIKALINERKDKAHILFEDGQDVLLMDKFESDLLSGVVVQIKWEPELGQMELTIGQDQKAETSHE